MRGKISVVVSLLGAVVAAGCSGGTETGPEQVARRAAPLLIGGTGGGIGSGSGGATHHRAVFVATAPTLGGTVAPGDYDGNGTADPAVKHDTVDVSGHFTIASSLSGRTNGVWDKTYGGYGGAAAVPAPADYDGDGRTDFAIKDSSTGSWCIDLAFDDFGAWNSPCLPGYGFADAHPVPADYDGDGRANLAIKSDEGAWYIDYASDGFGAWNLMLQGYGSSNAVPARADYDGDGRADLAIKDASGNWCIDYASDGFGTWNACYAGYGYADAHPVPSDYDGDGRANLAIKSDEGSYYIDYASDGFGAWNLMLEGYGYADAAPVPADYDGDGRADLAVHKNDGTFLIDLASNGFGSWDAGFNPDVVALSAGNALTAQDIAQFDGRWMNQASLQEAIHNAAVVQTPATATAITEATVETSSWPINDRMMAMVRMYDLTKDTKYLDHLRDLVNVVLAGRDDRMPDAAQRGDPFRGGKVMRAWGVTRVAYGDYHMSYVTMAGLYGWPMAAFARIVAENPALQEVYGRDAYNTASALIGTYQDFLPELVLSYGATGAQSHYVVPPRASSLLTYTRCRWADSTEASKDTVPADDKEFGAEMKGCIELGPEAGADVAYNETLIFVSSLVELSRALDTPFYGPDAATKVLAEQTIPQIVANAMRYFRAGLVPVGCGGAAFCPGGYYLWNYTANPGAPSHPVDDTSHGSYEMAALGLVWRDEARLDTLLHAVNADTVPFIAFDMDRFATTFTQRIGSNGSHLYANMGGVVPSPVDASDGNCAGWLDLTQFNPAVWKTCSQVTLAAYNAAIDANDVNTALVPQPHLTVGNHASLLANKVHLP